MIIKDFIFLNLYYFISTVLMAVLVQYKFVRKPKYKEPFSMDYMERGSHARGLMYIYVYIPDSIPRAWE